MTATTTGSWADLSKGKAFAIHFILSLMIFSTLVWIMAMWWFPGELFFLDGGWQGLKIVALIDLVLGPALTLLLYKPRKPKLLLDMSLIAGFQVAALAYGFYATYHQRTVAVVFADSSFITLSASAVKAAEQDLIAREKQPQAIKAIDDAFPAMLFTPAPKSGEFRNYVSELLDGMPEPHERLDLFEKRGPEHAETISDYATDKTVLEKVGADVFVDAAIKKGGFNEDEIELHNFKARYAQGIVLLDKNSQEILDYVPIDWQTLYAEFDAKAEQEEQEQAVATQSEAEANGQSNELGDQINTDITNSGPTAESVEQ